MNSVRFFFGAFARSASRKASISFSQRPGVVSPKTGVAVHKMTSQAASIAVKAKRRFSIRSMSEAWMLPIFFPLGKPFERLAKRFVFGFKPPSDWPRLSPCRKRWLQTITCR